METSSVVSSDDLATANFERTIANTSDAAIEIVPRDLRMSEYPRLIATEVTVGSFASGIWTIGVLEAGQAATIAYVGAAASQEELPFTGSRTHLLALATLGVALLAIGVSVVRSTRA